MRRARMVIRKNERMNECVDERVGDRNEINLMLVHSVQFSLI